ncbi:MAG: glycine cleavage system protein GcvH [Cytophagia bacterium]|nr:MAG: glycine cleavage system protein GcvH [Cytophagia bacterium]TAH31156.1 MAG: glycine cleavage system protein GcvH [Cytophagales bacterium]
MNIPQNLYYTKEHEWLRLEADNTAFIGITDYAQKELGDIVYIEIETVGQTLAQNEVFGTVEAVKTVSDLYLPVSAEILSFNTELNSTPDKVNNDAYGEGWLVKVRVTNTDELNALMKSEQYSALVG